MVGTLTHGCASGSCPSHSHGLFSAALYRALEGSSGLLPLLIQKCPISRWRFALRSSPLGTRKYCSKFRT